jgi:hypothetical protein
MLQNAAKCWGLKGGRRVKLTNLPPSVSRLYKENVGVSTSHNSVGLHGLLQAYIYLFLALLEALSPGVKRQGREANQSPPTSAEVNKMWICTSTPPCALMA